MLFSVHSWLGEGGTATFYTFITAFEKRIINY
jgi:hypothetical protein